MSIVIDLRSVIDEGVGASLDLKGQTEVFTSKGDDTAQLKLGPVEFCCTAPVEYEINLIHAGECVQAFGKVSASLDTSCVRCLKDFDFGIDADFEESFFFEPCDDEHGQAYPVIDESQKIDIEPLLREVLLIEAPFAPVHDSECQGLCVKCGLDLNEGECDCAYEIDASHPFASLKDIVN
jgi:uncharacterized protein